MNNKYCSYCGKKLVIYRSTLFQSWRCPRFLSIIEWLTQPIHGRHDNWHDSGINEERIQPGTSGVYDVETGKKL